jgi:phosphoribosyl-ATP pyrophosphohydrolase
MNNTLQQLDAILAERKGADPQDSYVAQLYERGLNKILEKVGEEATEVILAAKDANAGGSADALAGEVADLWFHSMVMLQYLDLDHTEVLKKLQDRFTLSGLEEKAQRHSSSS